MTEFLAFCFVFRLKSLRHISKLLRIGVRNKCKKCSSQPAAFGVSCRDVAMRVLISVTSCLSLGSDKMDILWFDPDVYLGVSRELFNRVAGQNWLR